MNCGAIPDNLFESEFFGHMRGSFTGVVRDKPGLFELADGGTLFLDEIGEVPLAMQAELLRVLQEQEIERVGALYIAPESPWENAYVGSFNSRLRDGHLNREEFASRLEAEVLAAGWRRDFNEARPHTSLAANAVCQVREDMPASAPDKYALAI